MERNRVKLSFFCWYWFRRGAGEYSRVGVGSVFVLVFFCFFFIFFIFVFFCNRKGRADPSASAHGNRWIMKASMNNEFVVLLISFHLCFFFLFCFLFCVWSTRLKRAPDAIEGIGPVAFTWFHQLWLSFLFASAASKGPPNLRESAFHRLIPLVDDDRIQRPSETQ